MVTDAEFLRRARQRRLGRSNFSNVQVREGALVRHLRSRHILWLHGWAMGLLTLLAMWLTTNVMRAGGVHSLALRYALALGVGYLCYLLLVRVWAGLLVRREEHVDGPDPLDLLDVGWPNGRSASAHPHTSGGGGDFGGGGAQGAWDAPVDAVGSGVADSAGSVLGDAASGALEVAGSADEGAIIVIPVLAVFGAVLATVFGAGWLLWLAFGTEALLAVAVELAFAYTAARTVVRVEREGWLLAAIRLTWKPLLGALVCAVVLGGLIDYLVPQATTLPEAWRLWQAR